MERKIEATRRSMQVHAELAVRLMDIMLRTTRPEEKIQAEHRLELIERTLWRNHATLRRLRADPRAPPV
ncbi:MAG: hypothetical protein SGJ21_06460 [Alphaproteobacteria bacterium]|nr:hypothetical protein [Alphaproteobacteria bacterium]